MLRATSKLESSQKVMSETHLASAGVFIDFLGHKSLIAITNSWNEVCPGHEPLKQLTEEVKKRILEAGGEPIEFNTVAMCDGIAQGHSDMCHCLPHREIIMNSIEAMVVGEDAFGGVIYMGSCDKIVSGMLNAMTRINLPPVIATVGLCYTQIKSNESKELRQQFLRGEIVERQLIEGALKYCAGSETCPFLGIANVMGALCESLGMMLPGGSLIPSSTSMRRFSVREPGRAVTRVTEMQIRFSQIMTWEALKSTIIPLPAIGGPLSTLIHPPALAAELGVSLDQDDSSKIITTTPIPCSIVPDGNRTVAGLYCASGIPAVMKELESVMNKGVLAVTGEALGQILERTPQRDREVIESMGEPVSGVDGIQVFHGSLVPQGALIKTSVVLTKVRCFKGAARVFKGEDKCYTALHAKEIKEGDAVIVRCEGPKGGPGMKEPHRITEIIKGIPNTVVITDSRPLGASGGLSIGHLCPEAAGGGPITLIRDGGRVTADLCEDYLYLEVSDEELEARRRGWKVVTRPGEKGLLDRYARLVNTTRLSAALNREQKAEE